MFKDKIRLIDIESIIKFSFAYLIVFFFKRRDVWLFSERHNEARDNGFWMFKYVRENYPFQNAYYVIDSDSKDLDKILEYKNIIYFGTFKHYIIYLMTTKHISAHVDADSPNSRVSNFLETHGFLKNKRVFLQHGITKDKISFGYYNVSRADLFVCTAKPEYDFCSKEFGYPNGNVKLLGFARFDGLKDLSNQKKQILLMPTWRSWLANIEDKDFVKSEYYNTYQNLITNKNLISILENNNLNLVFFPHSDMQKFISLFNVKSKNIIIANSKDYDVQKLLNDSKLLITDYSSVAFDFAYLNKPVFYYHFDYEKYRKGQHPEGYYSYKKDGFGPILFSEESLLNKIELCIDNEYKNDDIYQKRVNDFFDIRDKNNCNRIYNAIKEL